jgi:hypothetical protein
MSLKNLIQSKTAVLSLIVLFLLFVPFLIWGNTYLAGGDDTKLYYIFPIEFLKNYAFRIVSDNTLGGAMTGYASVSYFAPVFFVIALFKLIPFVSTQMLLYGLNLALGFLGFYKLIGLWINTKDRNGFYSSTIAGLFYVTSVYLVNTLYTHQLLAMYLVSVIPFTVYFFIKGVREDNFRFIIISTFIFSLFSSTINTLPWSAASFIALLPVLLYEAFSKKKRFLQYSLLFIALSFLLNFYWIFHLIYQYIHPAGLQTMIQYYSSADFIKDNIRIITGVSQSYSPLNIPFNQMDRSFFENLSWITVIQGIFFAVIMFALIFRQKVKEADTHSYFVMLAGLLLAWFFFSPNLGQWARDTFLYLSLHVPFFTMFRNMYDKFALSLSLAYAMSLAISLQILQQRIKHRIFVALCIALLIVIGGNFVTSTQYLKKSIGDSAKSSGTFVNDFTDLAIYLKKLHDPSHVVWIPMNGPTYANIEDKYLSNHYYSGLSPLRVLSDMSDYTGRFSFITQSDLFSGDKIFALLEKKKYDAVGKILQQRNAKYIIVDHQQLPANMHAFMYGGEHEKLLAAQNSEFRKTLLGAKIKDFGKRYSLYAINPRYDNDKVYLTDSYQTFPKNFDNLQYKRIASSQYDITINNLKDEKKLVFLDPFSKDWVLSLKSNTSARSYAQGENALVYNYANGWVVSPDKIINDYGPGFYTQNSDGSINVHLQLYFQPQKYNLPIYIISLGTFIILCAIVIVGLKKQQKTVKKNEK